ncbi:Uncharacterised protein [Salmonella enterica subsp. enterica serovar Bovismorbificans]|uniref:Uncharacterized protein n=1 Tax=Salmonella enterica subsp. enterica serovar Bovismorbificans TaxID=58097 RepID=A0A655CPJ2_SALET|nr:Uncharacterised protein [Salmonella enterica subsp. enterica serovar Bovismorbificans]
MRVRENNSQRDARQPRSCSYVDKTLSLKIRRNDYAVENMAYQHFVGIPH